jgi:hypothetical protein
MAGDEGNINHVCDYCHCHHFNCVECGHETLGDEGDEMCERCFRGLVEMDGVIRSLCCVLDEDSLERALNVLRRDYPKQMAERTT